MPIFKKNQNIAVVPSFSIKNTQSFSIGIIEQWVFVLCQIMPFVITLCLLNVLIIMNDGRQQKYIKWPISSDQPCTDWCFLLNLLPFLCFADSHFSGPQTGSHCPLPIPRWFAFGPWIWGWFNLFVQPLKWWKSCHIQWPYSCCYSLEIWWAGRMFGIRIKGENFFFLRSWFILDVNEIYDWGSVQSNWRYMEWICVR